jgi:hypothetical protein
MKLGWREIRAADGILVKKHLRKRPFGRQTGRLRDNIKMDVKMVYRFYTTRE